MIAENAVVPWIAQISVNLLEDEELLDLMAASGARCIFIGLESMDPDNLRSVQKSFTVADNAPLFKVGTTRIWGAGAICGDTKGR